RLHTPRVAPVKPLGTKPGSWWGTIDKFEAATFYRRVSIPLHYLRVRAHDCEATSQSQPRCRDQDAINARTNARTASAVTIARAAIPDARINAAANRVENARANLAPVN
ncbi:PREDICTED: uncharacterized protein LOC105455190, partial [Wasmannia auropunctata]|uniref:uncharacterized protein LOC105455190 n=1 Tax=Wasmannia auropunctata TaxID=64793 RepID=UPI0005EE5429